MAEQEGIMDKINKKIPVIIDTDIGDDVDDVIALCLAIQCPEIEILGVTTVFKNTRVRARIAKRLLKLGGQENVPVAAGASVPLSGDKIFDKEIDYRETPITYKEEYYEEIDESLTARQLIISLLEKSEEPITIVTLGALTNIAEVLRERVDLKSKIRQFNIMGGAYHINWSEYNFTCDPEAADIVFRSDIPIKAVGIDVTLKCIPSKEHMEKLEKHKHPAIKMMMEMCERWNEHGTVMLHDPLAVWSVFSDKDLEFEKQVYRIETKGRYTRGICVKLSDHNWKVLADNSKLEVAKDVNADTFTLACVERLLKFPQ